MSGDLRFTLEPINSITDVGREWSVFDGATETSFFTSWLWIGTWLSTLTGEIEPLLLRAIENDRTVALAVLVRRQVRRRLVIAARQLHFNATGDARFDCLFIEHNGFATDGVELSRLWRAFLEWFRSGQAGGTELVVGGVVEPRPELVAPVSPNLLQRVDFLPAFLVDLASLAEFGGDPVPALSRNARQQLNRALRLCIADGALEVDEARTLEEALSFFDAMKPLHVTHWVERGKPHAFVNPYFETFHKALIAAGFSTSATQLLRIRAGAQVLGYLYNFRRSGRVYTYQSGFDFLDRRRTGYVCHALAIRHSAQRGDLVYDFMAGANQLKRTFASREYQMGWHTLQHPLLQFRGERALRTVKHRIMGP